MSKLAIDTFYDTFKGTAAASDFEVALPALFGPARIAEKIADPANEVLVSEAAGQLVGYAMFRRGVPPFPGAALYGMELANLYVAKQWHGTGLAQALMQQFYTSAASKQLGFLWLGVWEHNYRAQRFYRKEGFVYSGHDHPFPIHLTPQTDQWWFKMNVATQGR